jgi:hypothetical protein
MSLHPVLAEKLSESVMPLPKLTSTLRDARLPCVSGKVHAVIGMRRAGKTTFLRQLLAQRRVESPAEQSIYMSFDDDRLGELGLEQLGFLLEEYYRRYPALRGATQVHWFLDEIQLVSGMGAFRPPCARYRENLAGGLGLFGKNAFSRGAQFLARAGHGNNHPSLWIS